MVEIMAKYKKIEETDFDFSKIPQKTPTYFFERFVASAFIAGFISLLILSPTVKHTDTFPPIQYEPFYDYLDTPSFQDYIVTDADKTMFASVFDYDSAMPNSFSGDKSLSFIQGQVRNADLINGRNSGNFEKNDKFNVKSSILAIEPSDKNSMVKATGNPDLDYVDLVVQKTYSNKKDSYLEQQMVSVTLDKHQIISMKTEKMID